MNIVQLLSSIKNLFETTPYLLLGVSLYNNYIGCCLCDQIRKLANYDHKYYKPTTNKWSTVGIQRNEHLSETWPYEFVLETNQCHKKWGRQSPNLRGIKIGRFWKIQIKNHIHTNAHVSTFWWKNMCTFTQSFCKLHKSCSTRGPWWPAITNCKSHLHEKT